VFSLQLHLFPLDFRWALLLMLVTLAASILLFERVIAMIVPRGWATVAVSIWFGFCMLWARPLQWWTFGVQTFPRVFFDLVCVYGFLRFYAEGRNRSIAVSAAALVAALLFNETPALTPVYLALIRVLFMSDALRPRALVVTFWRERRCGSPISQSSSSGVSCT
jgi:hypothetical protein